MRPRPGPPSAPPAGSGGAFAFVFWNDDLDDERVLGQLRFLAATGVRGVVLCARTGLSRRTGYLTPEFFRVVRLAVDECARLGLLVVLYDEASYPSGSANGQVVAEDPGFAARCLLPSSRTVEGPSARYWRPSLGRSLTDRLLAVVVHPENPDGTLGAGRLLPVEDRGLVRLDLPAGRWRVVAVFDVLSGGTIRGAHADQDDGSASAPPAADLLNPAAVQTFLELTHEQYATALGGALGTTVVALFTDEPDLLGRGARADAVPYTSGFEDEVARGLGVPVAEVLRRLPTLWAPPTGFTADYHRAVRGRLHRVYYGAQARWCEDHGVALTGHPAAGDDLETAATFHWPGQDTVWRWVLPGDGTALHGPESTAPKVAASAAHQRGHGTAVAEVLGAYGWGLTLAEAKWLLDWYLSRGVTTLVLHAFFASVRGNRAYESEPDLGEFTSLRPHVPALVRYVNRLADLFHGATHRARVGVVADPAHAPDRAAAGLLTRQVDFFYVTPADLPTTRFRAVVVDLPTTDPSTHPAADLWGEPYASLRRAGVAVFPGDVDPEEVVEFLRTTPGPVEADPPVEALRLVDLDRDGRTTLLCFNEGDGAVSTELLVSTADATWYDPFTDRRWAAAVVDGRVPLTLQHRQTLALELGGEQGCERPGESPGDVGGDVGGENRRELTDWTGEFVTVLGAAPPGPVAPGNWAADPEHRRTSGSAVFRHAVDLPDTHLHAGRDAVLDLGDVGEAAAVRWNGEPVGEVLWPPYRVRVPRELLTPGPNLVEVTVSNSPANHYEGLERPSGLLGPVVLSW